MKKILILSTILAVLTGCSSDDDAAAASALTHALLDGTWVSGCNVEAPFSFKVTVTLNNGSGSATTTDYSDDTCTAINMVENETFNYVIGKDVTVDGSVAGITTATQVNFTDTTPGAVPAGEKTFDIFAIANLITLYIGDTDGANDGSTAALRPTQLSSAPVFTKQ